MEALHATWQEYSTALLQEKWAAPDSSQKGGKRERPAWSANETPALQVYLADYLARRSARATKVRTGMPEAPLSA